jgi:hypothetical protein
MDCSYGPRLSGKQIPWKDFGTLLIDALASTEGVSTMRHIFQRGGAEEIAGCLAKGEEIGSGCLTVPAYGRNCTVLTGYWISLCQTKHIPLSKNRSWRCCEAPPLFSLCRTGRFLDSAYNSKSRKKRQLFDFPLRYEVLS